MCRGFSCSSKDKSRARVPSEGVAVCQLLHSASCFLCSSVMVTRSCTDFYGGPIQETSPYSPQSQMGGSKFTIGSGSYMGWERVIVLKLES